MADAEKDLRYSPSGIPLKPVYGPADIQHIDYPERIGDPGYYPYTRGLYPAMYRSSPWATLEVSGYGLPEETAERQRFLISQGQAHLFGRPAVHICFDLGTQYGHDCDDPLAQFEVGRCGTLVNSIEDMDRLFQPLPMEDMHTSFIICPSAPVILAMYVAAAEARGIPRDKLRGSINNCSIIAPIADNMIAFPLRDTLRLMLDVVKFCTEEMPHVHPVTFQVYSCRERGATAVQELAFSLAAALAVVRGGIERGLDVDAFAPSLVFFYSLNNNFFEEIAKLRAARRMWATIMRERFGARNPKSWMCQMLSQTSGSTLPAQEPLNNVARVAIQALAGVLGGVQAMHTCAYDEAHDIPTEEAVRVAVKTQRIIEHETGVTDVADPLGGSYYVEHLTDRVEEEAWKYLERIEELGGYIPALEKGYLQREIAEAAQRHQGQVETGERVIVGVNKYVSQENTPIDTFCYNPDARQVAVTRLKDFKGRRDESRVAAALEDLRGAACDPDAYLMPVILKAVTSRATVGEVMGAMRQVFGKYHQETVLAGAS